jgi:hypothetical protein
MKNDCPIWICPDCGECIGVLGYFLGPIFEPIFGKQHPCEEIRKEAMAPRSAQIVAEKVQLVCPYCGETIPNKDGTDDWSKDDLLEFDTTKRKCSGCDKDILVMTHQKARIV